MIYKRKCPQCGQEIEHKNIKSYKTSLVKNKSCVKCANERINNSQRKYSLEFLLKEDIISMYWIGIVLSDASLTSKGIDLTLNIKDAKTIEEFQKLVGNPKILNRKVRNFENFRVNVRNAPQVLSFINKYKIKLPKTYNAPDFENFEFLSNESLLGILFGIIDGDGSIYVNTKPYRKASIITITCHESWKEFYNSLFKRLNIFTNITKKKNSDTLSFNISRKQEVKKLYEKIISTQIKYMERKWKKLEIL